MKALRGTVVLVAVLLLALVLQPARAVFASGLATTDLTQGSTANSLAQSLVGTGVQISNVSYTGASDAAGTFSGGTGIIGFDSGVILSTGDIANVIGPNKYTNVSKDNGLGGDQDLTTLAGAGATTYDAAVLQFDIVPNADTVYFNYVFASDEYPEFVGSQYNDTFGFFVNGKNCALLPDQSPVSINNVNPNKNSNLYINNNFQSPNVAPLNTEMDGLTKVLTCQASVTPGQSSHIKLAIADATDHIYDSNVFLQAGSFSTTSPTDTTPPTVAISPGSTSGAINTTSASFSWSATDPGPSNGCCTYAYKLDGPGTTTGTSSSFGSSTTASYTGLADGTYTFSVVAKDTAGNASSAASQSFTVDTGAPAATVTFPAAGTLNNASGWANYCSLHGFPGVVGICGTASDNAGGSGVQGVAVAIQSTSGSTNGEYWNGSSFGSATPIWQMATGTTSWSYAFAQPADGTYSLQVQTTDLAGNVSPTTPASTFTVDTTPPLSNIAFPAAGSYVGTTGWTNGCSLAGFTGVVGVCGTAADGLSQVALVAVAIQSESGPTAGEYWNGSSFAPSNLPGSATCPSDPSTCVPVWLPTTGSYSAGTTYSWSYQFSLPSPDGTYAFASLAIDRAGNEEQLKSGVTISCSACNGSLGNGSLGNGSLGNGSLGNGSLGNGSLGNGSLGNGSLGNGSLGNGSLGNGSLGNGSLGNAANNTQGNGGCLSNGSLGNGSLGNGSLGNGVTAATACDTLVTGVVTTPPTESTSVDGQNKSGSVNINPTSPVVVQFSHRIDPSTLNNVQLDTITTDQNGNQTTAPATGITMSPSLCLNPCTQVNLSGLHGATSYSLTVNGVADLAGNTITGATPFLFSTAATSPLSSPTDNNTDSIPDVWESSFAVLNGPTINTGSWGWTTNQATTGITDPAGPYWKDLCLVENYMVGSVGGTPFDQHVPQSSNQQIVNAYAAHGIHLVIFEGAYSAGLPAGYTGTLYGGAIPMINPLGTVAAGGDYDFTQFDQLRDANFVPTGLAQLCHYAVIAHTLGGTTSTGASRGFGSSDFVVALGTAGSPTDTSCVSTDSTVYPACVGVGTPMQLGADVMHEMGHNLGLTHAGPPNDDTNYKPNYPSVMNYAWSLKGVPENGHFVLDYSSGTLPAINEASLSETGGLPQPTGTGATVFGTAHICPTSTGGTQVVRQLNATYNVDWNCNGTLDAGSTLSYDANGDGSETGLQDHNDWATLSFTGGTIGLNTSAGPLPTSSPSDVIGSASGPNPMGGTTVLYQPAGTSCNGAAGHAILQPINTDGTSVFKQGSTVSAKFRVCDYNGVSVGTSGVVSSFKLLKATSVSGSLVVNETVDSSTPDTSFRWDSTNQQWIFNISTKSLATSAHYYYEIVLNDGSKIDFDFSLK